MSNIDEALRLRELVGSGEITHGEAIQRLCQFSGGGLTPLGAKDVLRYAHLYAEGRLPRDVLLPIRTSPILESDLSQQAQQSQGRQGIPMSLEDTDSMRVVVGRRTHELIVEEIPGLTVVKRTITGRYHYGQVPKVIVDLIINRISEVVESQTRVPRGLREDLLVLSMNRHPDRFRPL